MSTFAFRARNARGEIVKAEVEADSLQAAAALLKDRSLFPIDIKPKAAGDQSPRAFLDRLQNRVSSKEKVLFTRQLATLINSGLPLAQCLEVLQEQTTNKRMQMIVANIHQTVEGGSTLASALKPYPDVFNDLYVALIAAGETSGTLDKTLARLANQEEKNHQISSKLRSALIYPAVVLVVILSVVILMLVAVVPTVSSVYKDLHTPVPWITKQMLLLSSLIKNFWWADILALIVIVIVLRRYVRTPGGRHRFDRLKLKVYLISTLMRKIYMARFSRTLGTLVGSGLPLLEALRIVKGAIGNTVLADELDEVIEEVKGGTPLSVPLARNKDFPIIMSQMIRVGEQAGTLDEMLDKLANYYEEEVDEMIRNMSTLIEPVMIVFLGVVVGGVILAVLGPIYALIGSVGQSAK